MEHFAIVQSLCRAALASPSDAVRQQVGRLRDALAADGDAKASGVLGGLLTTASRTGDLRPRRIRQSRAPVGITGEELTDKVQVPVDRETAAPLASVIPLEALPEDAPVFDQVIAAAVDSLLEEWRNADALARFDVAPSRTCLIYGAPGTGKTRLALWMARELGIPVVVAKLDGLVSSFLGTTSRNMGALFSFASRYRCVLLLDEFDAIAKVRDDPQEVGEIKRVVNTLLQNLDARRPHGLTFGITNHEALLDAAVWRRFEVQLAIPRPSLAMRVEIARHYLPPLDLPDAAVRLLGWLSEGSTGAEIETLVRSLKKSWALSEPDAVGLMPTLRRFATLNSGRLHPERRGALFSEPRAAARLMLDDAELGFDQNALAAVFDRDKATISRWLSRTGARRATAEEASGV